MSRRARRRYAPIWFSRNSCLRKPRQHNPLPKPPHRSLLTNLLTKPPPTVRDIPTRSARAASSRSILPNIPASAACNIPTLPLNDKEVVLTFDDGPILPYSDQILDILASQCVKVTYFLVGEMARAFPATVRRIYEDGHTIGTHSEDHPTRFGQLPVEKMRHEIDWGIIRRSQISRTVLPYSWSGAIRCRRKRTRRARAVSILIRHLYLRKRTLGSQPRRVPLCANSEHRPLYVVGQPQSQKATIKNVSTRPFAIAPN